MMFFIFMVFILGVNRPSDVSSVSHHVQALRSVRYAGEAEREPGHNIEVYINDVIFTVIESGQWDPAQTYERFIGGI